MRKGLDLLKLEADDTFYDLGSGDGRMVLCAAKWCCLSSPPLHARTTTYLPCFYRRYRVRAIGIEVDDSLCEVPIELQPNPNSSPSPSWPTHCLRDAH